MSAPLPTRRALTAALTSRHGAPVARALALVVAAGLLLFGRRAALAGPRLALVDGADAPHLHEALRVALQPWEIEVIDWPSGRPGADAPLAPATIAKNANARYVVWYEGGALIVRDEALDRRDARPLEALPSDDAEASAVALSVKTMLRLPPPTARAQLGRRWRLVPAARLGGRVAFDGDGGSGLRAQLGLEVAPPWRHGLRMGVLGELGPAATTFSNDMGHWSEWNVQVTVARDLAVGPWLVGLQLGGGVSRSALSGRFTGNSSIDDTATGAYGSAAVTAARGVGPLIVGATLALAGRSGAEYSGAQPNQRWQEPSLLAAVLATLSLPL